MSIRGKWEFEFSAGALLDAAKARLAYRETRVKFWEGEKDTAAEMLRTQGVTVTDGIVEQLARDGYSTASNNFNPVRGPTVKIDEALLKRLHEVQGKLDENRGKVREYQMWVAVLASAPPDQRLQLDYEDWRFFFEV